MAARSCSAHNARHTHLVEASQPVEQRPAFAVLQRELQLAVRTVAHTVDSHDVVVRLEGRRDSTSRSSASTALGDAPLATLMATV
jgi:hypothetical protein